MSIKKKVSAILLILLLAPIGMTACEKRGSKHTDGKLDTYEEMYSYVKNNYKNEFTLTLLEENSSKRVWEVTLKDSITFSIYDEMIPKYLTFDNTTFGPKIESYYSDYAKILVPTLQSQIKDIVSMYDNIELIEISGNGCTRFHVYNDDIYHFNRLLEQLVAYFNFPEDTNTSYFATVYDENMNIVDSFYYLYGAFIEDTEK